MITKTYSYHCPGTFYVATWYEEAHTKKARTIKEAKKQIREYLGLKKLPNGFAIWEKTHDTSE